MTTHNNPYLLRPRHIGGVSLCEAYTLRVFAPNVLIRGYEVQAYLLPEAYAAAKANTGSGFTQPPGIAPKRPKSAHKNHRDVWQRRLYPDRDQHACRQLGSPPTHTDLTRGVRITPSDFHLL
jgi:hypothetical protein